MPRTNSVQLHFDKKHAELRAALSAAACIGNTLWIANDETTSLERFIATDANDDDYDEHTRFPLKDYLQLPLPPEPGEEGEEVDIEGLAYADGYLWLTGSHSLARRKPDGNDSRERGLNKLATIRRSGNRYLLARIPVSLDQHGICQLHRSTQVDNITRTAASLPGDAVSNALSNALRTDPHLQAFLDIPGKDNGFDIEGLAVSGQRVFLGLRGPVLRGWACILELQPETGPANPAALELAAIGPQGQPYRKHFLKLDGLGIRDLCVHGDDLLILAGPTMSLEGEQCVYRWRHGAQPQEESLADGKAVDKVVDIPVDKDDHPEGMCLFPPDSDKAGLLLVYDPASDKRLKGDDKVIADLLPLDG